VRGSSFVPTATLLAVVLLVSGAQAEPKVSIQYDSEERLEAAERLYSELASEGYAVEIDTGSAASPCDSSGARPPSVPHDSTAWIRLTSDPARPDTVLASICYLGALPFLQQATSSAPSSDARTLAVATAEALNGLRSKMPLTVESAPPPRALEAPSSATEPTPSARGPVNSLVLGMALALNLPDYPAMPGASLRAALGARVNASLVVEAFVPTRGAELSGAGVTATVRTAWLRVGPRIGGELGDFELWGAVLAGPAVTWATAIAQAPRIGTADVSLGVLLSAAGALEYPRKNPVFASLSASASALLPQLRLRLGDDSRRPRGAWPVDASVGVGARWGGDD
jgi:hypothetical protein